MNDLSLKVQKIHNELSVKNSIIKGLKWYKNPTYIFKGILFLISIPFLFFLKSDKIPLIFLIWGIVVILIFFFLFLYVNKLICEKYNLKQKRKGFIWVFPDIKYHKKVMKLFYKKAVFKKALFGNEKDIIQLEIIEEDIKNSMIKPITSYPLQVFTKKVWPIIMTLYFSYVAILLTQSKNLVIDSKLIFAYTLLLLTLVSQILYLNHLIIDVLNSKYRKQVLFLKRILKLKTELKIKYSR